MARKAKSRARAKPRAKLKAPAARRTKPSPVKTILPRRAESVPLTVGKPARGQEAMIYEAFPAFASKVQSGFHYRTGINIFYTDADGQPRVDVHPVQFKVGAGNVVADLRALKAKIGTWKETARALGVGERYLRKVRSGGEGKTPGPRLLAKVESTQRERGVKPAGKSPRREWLSKAWTFARKLIKQYYQTGAEGIGHSIDFVQRSKRPFKPIESIPKATRRRRRRG